MIDVQSIPVKLVAPQPNDCGYYACLSYCWGGDQDTKLKTSNLPQFLRELPIESLGMTIQDAIETTRGLEIPYLWVDALCIIQDSAEDKHCQVERMHSIYRNSTVTIAAACAASHGEGFLRTQPGLDGPDHSKCDILELRIPVGPDLEDADITLHQCMDDRYVEPLDRRGWALQEFVLSPRLLIFGHHEARWSCQPVRYPMTTYTIHGSSNTMFLKVPEHLPLGSSELAQTWMGIVENYSQRQLSFADDRLLAIAAIAEEICRVSGDKYLFGMWKSVILQGLLVWYCDKPGSISECRRRSPTWSWASLDGSVLFPHESTVGRRVWVQTPTTFQDIVSSDGLELRLCSRLFNPFRKGDLNYLAYWPDLREGADRNQEASRTPARVVVDMAYYSGDREVILLRLMQVGSSRYERLGIVVLARGAETNWIEAAPLQDVCII